MKTQTFLRLSVIMLYWLCFCNHVLVVSTVWLEDQQSLLLKVKSDLKFKSENSAKLVSWHEGIDYSEWNGVTCDEKGYVTGLDLSGESIYGGLDNSSSLFSLQNLQVLNMASNEFNSEMPSGFSKLKNLTYLNLSQAGFVGHIPMEISHLRRLVTLDLSSSHLEESRLKLGNQNLGKLVQNLTRIRQLYLNEVVIGAKGQEWYNALLPLLSLEELSLSNCNLLGPLDSSLIRLKNLSVIRLDQNNLSSPVPETFANFPNLTSLHLSNCRLTGIFPEKIFQIATLSVIDISFNDELYGSFPEFPLQGSLQALVVSNTKFSGALPVSISNLRKLSILDTSKCQFNRTLPSSMSTLRKLTYLFLSFNDFTGPIPSLKMSKNLIQLDLSHNRLTGSITYDQFEGLRKLVSIDLHDNCLRGRIPSSLLALPLLRNLQLSNNDFEGQLNEFLNISSSMLEVLDLSYNTLEGSIPTSIFHLRSLNVLNLSSNMLNGTLKLDVILRLANLITLDLSYNNLSIDTNVTELTLSSLPMMFNVKLASCNLTEVPSFLRDQSQLSTLDLSGNFIQGSIPTWIWQLDSLVELNISHNLLSHLEGPVLNSSSTLKVLDLHSNHLKGKLPQPLCNQPNLLVLDVSYNNFKGTIPECLTQSKTLVVLNLKHNSLDGYISDTFPVYCALRTLNLNGNLLSAPIPKSLVNCTSLEVLDLGNNQINDGFPCFLKALPRLLVMVLRENKFHDTIECPQIKGNWHMLQFVDLAHNNFYGFLPGKWFKNLEAMMLDEPRSEVLGLCDINYEDTVTFTMNYCSQREFVKIFTSIDFSSNSFEGIIPEELMNVTGLHLLNLSNNALTGQIPSSIGNLKQMEVLDLSSNYFEGEIPKELASLSFLSYLNLSFNHLAGKIPIGTQIQSFDASPFAGNLELCGPPLTETCSGGVTGVHGKHHSDYSINLNILSVEFGLILGLGLVFFPVVFWKKFRQRYWKRVDSILCCIFPQLNLEYERRGGKSYQVLRWRRY